VLRSRPTRLLGWPEFILYIEVDMSTVVITFVLTSAAYGAVTYLILRRIAEHLKGNPEASKAFSEHVLIPVLGRKAVAKKEPEPVPSVAGPEDKGDTAPSS